MFGLEKGCHLIFRSYVRKVKYCVFFTFFIGIIIIINVFCSLSLAGEYVRAGLYLLGLEYAKHICLFSC